MERYVIREGLEPGKGRYARGDYTWSKKQSGAFQFGDTTGMAPGEWAAGHAECISHDRVLCRVVRLKGRK